MEQIERLESDSVVGPLSLLLSDNEMTVKHDDLLGFGIWKIE